MQRRTLIRARGLAAFRHALVDLALTGPPLDARRRAVIVPTRAAGELFRQSIEQLVSDAGKSSVILPDLLTREDWMARLAAGLGESLMSRTDREILLERAARDTRARHPSGGALFDLRPGLVAAMLDFYDELRRRMRTVRRGVAALFDELRVERGTDRGSENLIAQTSFLGFAFLAYERRLAATGGLDEHVMRARLIRDQPALPFDHLVIAVADHPSDPRGLWPADFDLIGRLRRLDRLDIVVTDEVHDAGFRERLERELPGIEEARVPDLLRAPLLVRPPSTAAGPPIFMYRDREEELRGVARSIRADAEETGHELTKPVAVVFQRPLPYLYLGQQVLGDAGVPFQAFDALPLAAEPYAALVDLVLAVARTGGTREAAIALMRSGLVRFDVDGADLDLEDVAALDAVLANRRVSGLATTYASEVDDYFRADARRRESRERAERAARAAAALGDALASFRSAASASAQVTTVSRFLREHERVPGHDDGWLGRYLRARAATLAVLDELAAAYQRHDNAPRDADVLTARIHHALESRTFTPRRGTAGVHLVDAVAARFGDFSRVYVVGLVETDWPERMKRGMFYSTGLLRSLGWPQESEQMRAEQAAFRDLLSLAAEHTMLTAFQLEGDAVVAVSPMVESLRGVPTKDARVLTDRPLFPDEVLTRAWSPAGLDVEPASWLAVRRARPALSERAYCGFVDPQAPRQYRVSRVDRYVDCPFKYFSESVLQLSEERDEMSGLTPIERGLLLHQLFERFYGDWQAEGRGAITPENLPAALELFSRIADDALGRLPEVDRYLEGSRFLGSLVTVGVAERVFELEADSAAAVRERRLESTLNGPFRFPELGGLRERTIEIRGKADRIDILGDGSLRVIDYKLGRMPDLKTSLQIAVYAHCAKQVLEAEGGRSHPVSAAMYLAFGDDRRLEGPLGSSSEPVGIAVETRAGAFAVTVAGIEAGEFPPRPKRPNECQWCGYAGVCRKEYLAEDDEAADAV